MTTQPEPVEHVALPPLAIEAARIYLTRGIVADEHRADREPAGLATATRARARAGREALHALNRAAGIEP